MANFPKRMDIWSVYMDMEMKYAKNEAQVKQLLERGMQNEHFVKKSRKFKNIESAMTEQQGDDSD